MADKLTPEQRSALMSRIRSKNTKPEIAVRKFLHARGFRFRLHDKNLPGTPDIVLPKYRTAIFVNGCLWHGHFFCARYRMPKSNPEYWRVKIRTNKRRDKAKARELERAGWKTIIVWECEVSNQRLLGARLWPLRKTRGGTFLREWIKSYYAQILILRHALGSLGSKARHSAPAIFGIKRRT